MSARRPSRGGHGIDRGAPIGFIFEGHDLTGFEGDTVASALLANGVAVVCSSPILGRPRGVFSAGAEEPCAFVQVARVGAGFDPVMPATMVKLLDHLAVAGVPGVGRLPADDAGAHDTDHRHLHVETLIVGGGVAGLREAIAASARGDRVLLVDERHWLGGTITSEDAVDGIPGPTWVEDVTQKLDLASDTTVLTEATAAGVYDDGYVVVFQRSGSIARVWHVRAARVVLATGAHERPIAFADCDRPGVMLASSARLYADRFGVLTGERAVVFTTNHTGHEAAAALSEHGLEIAAIVDVGAGGPATEATRARGTDVRTGWAVTGTEGDPSISAVHIGGPGDAAETIEADLLLVSGGWNPAVQLWRGIEGGLRYDEERACFLPDGGAPPWLEIVGAAAGEVPTSVPFWFTPSPDLSRHFVDLQRDSTVADVLDAVGHELRSTEHVKRATYIGTAIDQGRTSGVLTAAIVNQAWGAGPGAQGPTNARPPYTPIPYAALAGRDRGPRLLDPVRTTPIHDNHVERGAVFENVGQWKRPWYFPNRPDEPMEDAVLRECAAVRTTVGVLDASTLGKIDVVGPDAAEFLDRMYTNRMSTLGVGSIRYGLMLGLDGMVFDDGVVMRLAADRFFVTTTTGGAANVLDRFEEWLQTELPELQVYCTSVTEQWATVAINGPRARDVLANLGPDLDLDAAAFGFMTWRHGTVAGLPSRVARVSFTGELAFEINVAGFYGPAMWEAVMIAGAPFGIAPYGTETMHVLRAEKAFVIVGQDTDGTVTPDDLGMSWIVRTDDSDFVGRRSLSRPDTVRPNRKQLVGVQPVDPQTWLPEGAQLVTPEHENAAPPVPMLGHVTSSYRSAVLGRTFALAMVKGGRAMHGSTVVAPIPGGAAIEATITEPVLFDPRNTRRDGDPSGSNPQASPASPPLHHGTGARDPLASRADDLTRVGALTGGSVLASHTPFIAQVNLRLDPSSPGPVPFPLPVEPNTAWEGDGRSALWLGPNEWLILGPAYGGQDLVDELERELGDRHCSVADVSANRVAIALSGAHRAELLAKGCPLDLHPRSWSAGMCAQSMLGKAQVILHERAGMTTVLVRASFADYLVEWLLAAANQLDP
jgi:sarcosine oxidase, subunit alpha